MFGISLSFDQQYDVLHMMRLREHVDGLDIFDLVLIHHESKIAGLCGWVTADVDDFFGANFEDLPDNPIMHTCTRGVGDDHIRAAIFLNEFIIKHPYNIAGIENGIIYIV